MAPKRRRGRNNGANGGPRNKGPRLYNPTTQDARDAGSNLLKILLQLYASCKVSATDFCNICFFADAAGVPGANFAQYSLAPGKGSGKYQRLLSQVLPQPSGMICIKTPVNLNRSFRRSTRDTPIRCTFESLEEELTSDTTTINTLLSDPDERDQCILDLPCYTGHPTVQDALEKGERPPLPIAVYLDGVTYMAAASGRSDSALGIWVINLIVHASRIPTGPS